jgi:hypothetical protein
VVSGAKHAAAIAGVDLEEPEEDDLGLTALRNLVNADEIRCDPILSL